MRYRERYFPNDPNVWSWNQVQKETFLDDPDPARKGKWKRCSHTRQRVLESQAMGNLRRVACSRYSCYVFGIVNGPYAAFAPWNGPSNEHGWFYEELPQSDLSLPPIDVNALRMQRSRSSANLAEIIATFKDTLGLFARPWQFANHLREIKAYNRAGTLRNAKDAIDRAADTWLQGTYGYLPFISDLSALTDVCRNPRQCLRDAVRPETQTIHQTTSGSLESSPPTDPKFGQGFVHTQVDITLTRTVQIQWLTNPTFAAMSVANQLATYMGLNDFGRLAWELTPYSFVVDWFTNLGEKCSRADALNGHYAVNTGNVLEGIERKEKRSRSGRIYVSHKQTDDWHYYIQCDSLPRIVDESLTYSRDSVIDPDKLDGVFLTNGLSTYRTATGLALLVGPVTSFLKFLNKR